MYIKLPSFNDFHIIQMCYPVLYHMLYKPNLKKKLFNRVIKKHTLIKTFLVILLFRMTPHKPLITKF